MLTTMKSKKVILAFTFATVCFLTYAQTQLVYDSPDHLKFNDIPLNGHINEFVKNLEKKGFSEVLRAESLIDFEGNYMGKPCTGTIFCSEKTKIVYNVLVYLTTNEKNWQTYKIYYFETKKALQIKYGLGSSVETFLSPYAEGDGRETEAINNSHCIYKTDWVISSGRISLVIMNDGIAIEFSDKKNELVYKNEKPKNIDNDDEW